MKKECDIVQDLLFGYADKTLKEGSKEFVEEHLKTCKNCNGVLKELMENENKDEKVEIEGLKKVKKSLKAKKIIITLMAIIVAIFIFYSIFVCYEYTNNMKKIEIYFKEDVTTEQMNLVKEMIYKIDENAEIEYSSEGDNFNELMENMDEDTRYLLDGYEDSKIFSKSFSVNLKSYKRDKLKEELDECEYVKSINTPNYTILDIYGLYFFKLVNL